jgi:hypothetical protein
VTLDPKKLKDAISPLFRPKTMPTGGVPQAVRDWLAAYVRYGQDAVAGGTAPAALLAPIPGPDGRFADSLDSALRTMWTAVTWVGPGLTGTTLLVPPLAPILEGVAAVLIKSRDPEQALSLITNALHTYTLSITVTVVPPSGTPATVPLV